MEHKSISKKERSNVVKSESKEGYYTEPARDVGRAAKMIQWMWLFRIFILVGVTIFTIGQIGGISDANLAAYVWFMVGLIATWVLAMRLMAKSSNSGGFSGALNSLSIMLPNLGTLIPLSILIFVTIKIRPILDKHINSLPNKFFWFNRFTFFLVVMQLFILHKFYSGAENVTKGRADQWRSVWVGAIILFSVLTSAAAVELFVITTSFITDG